MKIRFKKVTTPLITYSDGQTPPKDAPNNTQNTAPNKPPVQQSQPKKKSHKFMKLGIGFVVVIAIISVMVAFAVNAYLSGLSKVEVEVTNLLPNSATLVWVSENAHEGMAVASTSALEPRQFSEPTEDQVVGYDDRDYTNAQLVASRELADTGSDGSIEEGLITSEVEVVDFGKYKVHHVTFKNLEPSTTYNFLVGNGYLFRKAVGASTFTTKAKQDNFDMPAPAYGIVVEADESTPVKDGVFKMHMKSTEGVVRSTVISTPLTNNGSWYVDLSNLYSTDGKKFLERVTEVEYSAMLEVQTVMTGKGDYEREISVLEDAPAPDFILTNEIQVSSRMGSNLGLINQVFAIPDAGDGGGGGYEVVNYGSDEEESEPEEEKKNVYGKDGCDNPECQPLDIKHLKGGGRECLNECNSQCKWEEFCWDIGPSNNSQQQEDEPEVGPDARAYPDLPSDHPMNSPVYIPEEFTEQYESEYQNNCGACRDDQEGFCGAMNFDCLENNTADDGCWKLCINGCWEDADGCYQGYTNAMEGQENPETGIPYGTKGICCWDESANRGSYQGFTQESPTTCVQGEFLSYTSATTSSGCTSAWNQARADASVAPETASAWDAQAIADYFAGQFGGDDMCCYNGALDHGIMYNKLMDVSCPEGYSPTSQTSLCEKESSSKKMPPDLSALEEAMAADQETKVDVCCDYDGPGPGQARTYPVSASNPSCPSYPSSMTPSDECGETKTYSKKLCCGYKGSSATYHTATSSYNGGFRCPTPQSELDFNVCLGVNGVAGAHAVPTDETGNCPGGCPEGQECKLTGGLGNEYYDCFNKITTPEVFNCDPDYAATKGGSCEPCYSTCPGGPIMCELQPTLFNGHYFRCNTIDPCRGQCEDDEECKIGAKGYDGDGSAATVGFFCEPRWEGELRNCENDSRRPDNTFCDIVSCETACDPYASSGYRCALLSSGSANYYACKRDGKSSAETETYDSAEQCVTACNNGLPDGSPLESQCSKKRSAVPLGISTIDDSRCDDDLFVCQRWFENSNQVTVYPAKYYCEHVGGQFSSQNTAQPETDRLSLKGIFEKVGSFLTAGANAQEDAGDYDGQIIYFLPQRGTFVFSEAGTYMVKIAGEQFEVVVGDAGQKIVFVDANDNGIYEEGIDSNLGEFGDIVQFRKTNDALPYSFNTGYNLVSFNFINSAMPPTGSEYLNYLNGNTDDAFYSISSFENGSWKTVGVRDGVPYGIDNFQVIPGKGYLVKAKGDVNVDLPGKRVFTPVPVKMSAGWNLAAVHGSKARYSAKTWIESIDGTTGMDADNISTWIAERGRYDGLQMSPDSEGNEQVYGFDFPIYEQNAYFVKIVSGEGVWRPQ